ncbi:MAG TPA: LamB/YcsF family protein, partial [Candidatus Methylomirabilis sp.]|nr:LamB/YcsF family protein [Candidatus Methylomirabilis sp.]
RAYEPDGILRKRTLPGALLEDPAKAAAQAVDIATRNTVVATDGSELKVDAETVCIHSDTPGSALIARAVNEALKKSGVLVRALSV